MDHRTHHGTLRERLLRDMQEYLDHGQRPDPAILEALEGLPCCPICGPYDRCHEHHSVEEWAAGAWGWEPEAIHDAKTF